MSLDQNLFTLVFTPHKENSNVVDLVDPNGTVHYRKQRIPGVEYKMEVYDPMSESLLAIATAPAATSKVKTLELYNPTSVVELKYSGTLSFRWSFKWEEHEFEWKREECFMIRKPDPPVIIAVTKEPAGRLKSTSIQILDYNLNRFDIDDRKGLEIVVLTALMTFHDSNEAQHNPEPTPIANSNNTNNSTLARVATNRKESASNVTPPPLPPPRPAPRTGIDRIAEMQAIQGEYNEILVSGEGTVNEYGEYCHTLLQDEAMLFITIKSTEAIDVPKVLQVVEETKRIRHKAGLSDDEELHQYVLYDTQEAKKGPRRINLDDEPKDKYAPPKNLTVHLSKIPLPELQPKGQPKEKPANESSKKKEGKKIDNATRPAIKTPPTAPTPTPSNSRSAAPSKPPPKKLHRPSQSSSSLPFTLAHQVHPNQPSPSPSQLNNPVIYNAPPPKPRAHGHRPNASTPSFTPGTLSFPQPQIPSGPQGGRSSPYGSYTSASPPGYNNNNFPPASWSTPRPPPPPSLPHLYQPQPVSPSSTSPATAKISSGASAVVQGLMDKLTLRR